MRAKQTFKLKSKIVVFPGMGAWRFLMVEKKVSDTIKKTYSSRAVGFGSIRVHVQIGKTKWDTSIFPDKKSGVYLLPTKAAVRKAEGIVDDEPVAFTINIA